MTTSPTTAAGVNRREQEEGTLMTTLWHRRLAAFAAAGLILSGCGGDDDGTADSTSPDTPTGTAAAPATADGGQDASGCEAIDLSIAPDEPVMIRVAHGFVVDEPLWLIEAKPELATHRGVWYDTTFTAMRANEDRFTAFQAGEADMITASAPALIKAVAQDIPVKAILTEIREASDGFQTTYIALEDSGITSMKDLKGAKIGIVDFGSSTDYWARAALTQAGLDPERDAEYVVLPFPSQEEALRAGQIDVAVMVEPFYTVAQNNGGVVDVFTSIEATGLEQEPVQFINVGESFLAEHPEAVCALIDDFQSTLEWYTANVDEAREVLVDEGFVQIPIDVYQASKDYSRPAGGAVDVDALDNLIKDMRRFGVLSEDQSVEGSAIVADGFAPLPTD